MDTVGTSIGGAKSSALPRFSRLPHTSRSSGSVDEGQSIPSSGVSSLPSRPARSSTMDFQRPPSAMRTPANPLSPTNKRQSMLMRPGFHISSLREAQEGDINNLTSPMSPPAGGSKIGAGTVGNIDGISSTVSADKPPRKARPSLSDRTMETLSQVPPTPSPQRKPRPQSGFYGLESPMRPPSRAASALSFSRPDSRAGNSNTGIRPPETLKSPTKGLASAGLYGQPLSSPPSKRMIGSSVSQSKPAVSTMTSQIGTPRTTKMKPPSSTTGLGRGIRPKQVNGQDKIPSRSGLVRSPTKEVFGGPLPQVKSTATKPAKQLVRPSTVRKGPLSTTGLSKPVHKSQTSETDSDELDLLSREKSSLSSQSLRDAISKAKGAAKSGSDRPWDNFVPRSVVPDAFANIGPDADPNTLDLVDSAHINIVKKRIHNARADGKLNIAALCLTEVPTEVLKMYEFDANDENSSPWYENVDVTRLIAADNEFTVLPEVLFPSRKSSAQMEYDDEEGADGIFGGLQLLDVRGNQLSSIPSRIGNLELLTTLNVSRNKLDDQALRIISTISSLRELHIGENVLSASLPDEIGNLENLELLDVQKNSIVELPSSIGKLSKLRTLNVSGNRLSSLPFEAIFDLPLSELIASRNHLSGALLPNSIPHIPSLRTLDVSVNALICITESKVDLPLLQTLNINNNRVSELPDISNWSQLTSLNAEENKISAIPDGFTKLSSLTSVDLGNNSLLQIDEAIGFMDNLAVFRIGNNPIRDRRLLKMGIEELKSELRSRQAAEDSTSKLSSNGGLPLSPSSSSWPVSSGTVDRSNTKLSAIDRKDIEPIVSEEVRSLILHHNTLQSFSPAIELLGGTLTSLDLSHNKLGKGGAYMTNSVVLPNLQTLNLTSNALTSLEPLVTHLSAPRLATLIVLFNRLTELPLLCKAFPALTKLLASNNAVTVLDVESVRGLQVLDVSSNEIEHLPPKLGILQGQLRTLMVGGNKFRVPGWGVLEKGTEEILKFCKNRIPVGEEGAITDGVD